MRRIINKGTNRCFANFSLLRQVRKQALYDAQAIAHANLLMQNDKDIVSLEFSVADKSTKRNEAAHNEI